MAQIRCDQCGRVLAPHEPATVVCPSCGRANVIPADLIATAFPPAEDTTTRPVPPLPAETLAGLGAAAELAERPTAPPPPPLDPLTAPAAPLGGYVPPSVPRSGGVPFAQERVQAGSGQEPALDATATLPPAFGGPAAMRQGSERRGMGRLTAISGAVLLILLLIGSGGAVMVANGTLGNVLGIGQAPAATATAAATPTAMPQGGLQSFASPDGAYQLKVPSDWARASYQTLETFIDPATQASFEIQILTGVVDPTTVDGQFIHAFHPPSATGSVLVTGTPTTDSTPLAGILWTRQAADIVVPTGGQTVTWHVVVLAAQHNQNTLLIAYFSPQAIFATEDTTYFTPMLNSLTLG